MTEATEALTSDPIPDLTREELQEMVDELGTDLYRAQDLIAFVREMCDAADADGSEVTTERVRGWLAYTGCGGVIVLPEEALPTPATQASAVAGPATRSEEKHGPQFRWILSDGDNDFGRWHDLEGNCDACCCGGVKECTDCGGREHHEPIEKPGGGTMHDWVCQTCRETPGGDPAEVEER